MGEYVLSESISKKNNIYFIDYSLSQFQAYALWKAAKIMMEEELVQNQADAAMLMESMTVLAKGLDAIPDEDKRDEPNGKSIIY